MMSQQLAGAFKPRLVQAQTAAAQSGRASHCAVSGPQSSFCTDGSRHELSNFCTKSAQYKAVNAAGSSTMSDPIGACGCSGEEGDLPRSWIDHWMDEQDASDSKFGWLPVAGRPMR
eukprot:761146-Hanusia_phi.AAC.5